MSAQQAEHYARMAANSTKSDEEALRNLALAIVNLAQAVRAIEAKVARIK